jgi:hypothetical protein
LGVPSGVFSAGHLTAQIVNDRGDLFSSIIIANNELEGGVVCVGMQIQDLGCSISRNL